MGLCQYVDLCFRALSLLVCILFGMPSLHIFTFLMFFKSCFCTFFLSYSQPKPKNISSVTTTPELETALTV